ncbi:probable gluconokinase isoform X2 [Microtus oregoni]|uniref:probable gluconokinase isoform X2 n=1 Tax=Microtus oregoni TaxID=111838 RepID=UPI001BB1B792|nr:probable gluconokinase isoform X2 [Microtus oregoni]XP_041501609.1 probable gluconokinase isoform X2 [Microtus oregoni]
MKVGRREAAGVQSGKLLRERRSPPQLLAPALQTWTSGILPRKWKGAKSQTKRSTVGTLLASKLGWKFYDADDYHSEENRMKMGRGVPLSDQDRIPWLCSLHDILVREVALGQHVVLACSALKRKYRDILIQGRSDGPLKSDGSAEERLAGQQLLVVYLSGSFEIISRRLSQRKGHFMPPELLQSQFSILEPPSAPEHFIQVSVDQSLSEIADAVLEALPMK